ncbi:flagellar protein FlaG [Clostridium sp. BL-8]|uniref:flagellar protein FlaG n=1 Tax=Clostridium sp. BL-8 TaxID=349938 RepID=UPI00098BF84D|nr:flagellar protein FlaG [Clostridium sp. BL-8]OOM79982.1 flagellar protein FlaG [Clostridium sp. BL-8]
MDVKAVLSDFSSVNQYDNSGKTLEEGTSNSEKLPDSKETTEQNIDGKNTNETINNKDKEAIEKLNKLLEKDKTHAEYSVYKKLGRTVIKIVNDETDEVVMEIPKEKLLDAIAGLLENAGLIDKRA